MAQLPKITENKSSYFGWKSEIGREFGYNKLTLLKEMDTIPIEGVFICCTGGSGEDNVENYEAVFVGIHYPSKIFLSFLLILIINSFTHMLILL